MLLYARDNWPYLEIRFWNGSSYSQLQFDLPNAHCRRAALP